MSVESDDYDSDACDVRWTVAATRMMISTLSCRNATFPSTTLAVVFSLSGY
jgi:hypothetical protein